MKTQYDISFSLQQKFRGANKTFETLLNSFSIAVSFTAPSHHEEINNWPQIPIRPSNYNATIFSNAQLSQNSAGGEREGWGRQ